MSKYLKEALNNVNMTYDEIVVIADEIVKNYSEKVDNIISSVIDNVATMQNEQLRNVMIDLSFAAYSLSDARDHAVLKSDCAESLMKEMQAVEFNMGSGTVDARKNAAIINSSGEIVADMIHTMIANSLKSKNDEVHRIVDTIKNVLVTRNTEASFNLNEK